MCYLLNRKKKKSSFSQNKLVLKKLQHMRHMREGKSLFEKTHPFKYCSYEYLPWWPEPAEKEIIRLCLCHTIFVNFKVVLQPKKMSQFQKQQPEACYRKSCT